MFKNANEGGQERKMPYIVEGGPVNVDSARNLVADGREELEAHGSLSRETVQEIREKISVLEEQKALFTDPEAITTINEVTKELQDLFVESENAKQKQEAA